jgi:hypothetical protein
MPLCGPTGHCLTDPGPWPFVPAESGCTVCVFRVRELARLSVTGSGVHRSRAAWTLKLAGTFSGE